MEMKGIDSPGNWVGGGELAGLGDDLDANNNDSSAHYTSVAAKNILCSTLHYVRYGDDRCR